jgi:hypothetical protein
MGTWNTWLARFLLSASLLCVQANATAEFDPRDQAHLQRWIAAKKQESVLAAFEDHLRQQDVHTVVPIHQLLRTATDWQTSDCVKVKAQPFEIPRNEKWAQMVKTLKLVHLLRERGILPAFEVVSAYRNSDVDLCAKGNGFRHPTAGALDLFVAPAEIRAAVKRLCAFHASKEGIDRRMGFSQYPTGRLHIDTVRHNTWGHDTHTGTSVCPKPKKKSLSPQR